MMDRHERIPSCSTGEHFQPGNHFFRTTISDIYLFIYFEEKNITKYTGKERETDSTDGGKQGSAS